LGNPVIVSELRRRFWILACKVLSFTAPLLRGVSAVARVRGLGDE
jgi:hypothetical protein